ncbi:unnamed protein product [Somion occarium]|uniref:Uncharacterized protein n=1 Tax=Somion occarium TaxID=3059160 RepID=A0ABP1CRR8_9APHY
MEGDGRIESSHSTTRHCLSYILRRKKGIGAMMKGKLLKQFGKVVCTRSIIYVEQERVHQDPSSNSAVSAFEVEELKSEGKWKLHGGYENAGDLEHNLLPKRKWSDELPERFEVGQDNLAIECRRSRGDLVKDRERSSHEYARNDFIRYQRDELDVGGDISVTSLFPILFSPATINP